MIFFWPPLAWFLQLFSSAFYSPRHSRYLSTHQPLTAESSLSEGISVAYCHCPHYWQVALPVSKSEGLLSLLRLSLLPQASCYFQDCGSSISLSLEITTQTQQLWSSHCVLPGGRYNKETVVESCHEEGSRDAIRQWHELSNQGNMWRIQRGKLKGVARFSVLLRMLRKCHFAASKWQSVFPNFNISCPFISVFLFNAKFH